MYLYDKIRQAAEVAAATLEARQMTMVYNDSTIALAYGFTDYFDEESFGRVNTLLGKQEITPSKFGQSSQLVTATPFIVTIGMAALMLRFFARARFCAKFWWDDLFAVLAAIFIIAEQMIYMRIVYLGRATLDSMLQTTKAWEEERVERITIGLKLYMVFELLYLVSSFFVKYSFLFLYLRISKETKKIRWFLRAAFLITTLTFIFCILALFLTCMPVSDFWNIKNPEPQCSRKILLTYGSGISNIATDAIVLAIPMPLLIQATLNKSQMRGVFILYLCGAFVIVASVLRFVTQLKDVSMLQTMGWSQLEVSLALILACAPMGAKLLSAPLNMQTGCPLDNLRKSNNFGRQYDYSSPFDKTLPTPPTIMTRIRGGSIHISRIGLTSRNKANDLAQEDAGKRRIAVAKRGVLVKEMQSPVYRKLKLGTSSGANGQTVWEVQPLSATTASEATFTSSTPSSRSPTITTARSPYGGLEPPPRWIKDLSKDKGEEEETDKDKAVNQDKRDEAT